MIKAKYKSEWEREFKGYQRNYVRHKRGRDVHIKVFRFSLDVTTDLRYYMFIRMKIRTTDEFSYGKICTPDTLDHHQYQFRSSCNVISTT